MSDIDIVVLYVLCHSEQWGSNKVPYIYLCSSYRTFS